MSWVDEITEKFHADIDKIKAIVQKFVDHEDPKVAEAMNDATGGLDRLKNLVETDVSTLGKQAGADAQPLGHAGMSALRPVGQGAVQDVEALATEAKNDIAAAPAELRAEGNAPAATTPDTATGDSGK